MHEVPEQVAVVALLDDAHVVQLFPQEPQLELVLRATQLPPQSVPDEHTQLPPEHDWPDEHAWPQEPQLYVSLEVLTQLPPQSVPDEQTQLLFEQYWPEAHALPQPPQFFISLDVLTQLPLQHTPPVQHDEPHIVPPPLAHSSPALRGHVPQSLGQDEQVSVPLHE
jgi:hypothetical protein